MYEIHSDIPMFIIADLHEARRVARALVCEREDSTRWHWDPHGINDPDNRCVGCWWHPNGDLVTIRRRTPR